MVIFFIQHTFIKTTNQLQLFCFIHICTAQLTLQNPFPIICCLSCSTLPQTLYCSVLHQYQILDTGLLDSKPVTMCQASPGSLLLPLPYLRLFVKQIMDFDQASELYKITPNPFVIFHKGLTILQLRSLLIFETHQSVQAHT